MREFNWKTIIYLIAIVILAICALGVVTASAINTEVTQVPIPTDMKYAKMGNTTNGTIEVYSRDTIYWGDVVDLSLVDGWYARVMHARTGKVVDVSSFTHRILIDSDTFPTGEYDQWSGFDEAHGNTVAFFVQENRPVQTNVTPIATPNTTLIHPYVQPVQIRHVSDILVAKGDPLNIEFTNAKIWIFGRTFAYYDFMTVNNSIVLSAAQVQKMEAGSYTLVAEQPGNKTPGYAVRYDTNNSHLEYFDPIQFKVMTVDFTGLDPETELNKFRQIEGITGDVFTEYKLEVQNPSIEITSLDQQYINETIFTQTVRGYTNVDIGTPMKFIVDQEKETPSSKQYSEFSALAEGSATAPGDMRWFEITLPLVWDNFAAGHHTVNVTTTIGGETHVDFDVHIAPEHSFIPNNTVKYVSGNEYIEPPTPVIIEHQLPAPPPITIIQTVTVPVPPSQESVNAAAYDANVKLAWTVGTIVGVIVAIICLTIWFRSAYGRLRERREKKRYGR